MKIEDYAINMINARKELSRVAIPPCSEVDITEAESSFNTQFGYLFPDAYKLILRHSNGIKHNGLIIWPATPQSIFQETIQQANTNLRDSFSDKYIYYAQRDEELYVFNMKSQEYCAIEFVGKPIWNRFSNADEMFKYVLERAWD